MIENENIKIRIVQDRSGMYEPNSVIESKDLINDYIIKAPKWSSCFNHMPLHDQISHISKALGLRVATVSEGDEQQTCYISLPISGYDIEERIRESEKARFRAAKALGYKKPIELLNISTPFDINSHISFKEYARQMGNNIEAILNSDVVYFCKDWHCSKECRAEYEVAQIYDKEIIFE